MNIAPEGVLAQPYGVSLAHDPRALVAFHEPECAAALWKRDVPAQVQRWLDALDPDVLPRGRVVLQTQSVARTVGHLFIMSGLPEGLERDWLHEDIVTLAHMFSTLMQSRYLRLRLDVVATNSCRKFHVDAITARLVCTYRGTGTQYGTSESGGDPGRVFTAKTGAPILLRGSLWPAEPSSGLLHRSPPIEGTGETRLVLVLDPVDDPEAEQ